MERLYKTLTQAVGRGDVWEGDVLLYRGRAPLGWIVSKMTSSEYTHAAIVGWWEEYGPEDIPFVLETRELRGSRAVTLAKQVAANKNTIDVFRLKKAAEWDRLVTRKRAVDYMRRVAGASYGYRNVLWAALRHLPFVRWFSKPDYRDAAVSKYPPYCSQLVDQAYRDGGVDLVPMKAGVITEPGDLASSAELEYKYTFSGV